MATKNFGFLSRSTLFAISFLLFQSCSKTSFGVADSTTSVGDQIISPTVLGDYSRTKILFPETTEVQQNQKIKALLVVDNSGTMANSQQNLANNISALLNELSKYDAEILVVSTTYSESDCPQNISFASCIATASYKAGSTNNSTTVYDSAGQPHTGTARTQGIYPKTLTTFKMNPNLSQADKDTKITEIANKIKSLGTTGSSGEKPLSVAFQQADAFFKENDRGLIFIITDEDDTSVFDTLTTPHYEFTESASINPPSVPGYSYGGSRPAFTYSGMCSYSGEGGQSNQRVDAGSAVFATLASCEISRANMGPNCNLICGNWNERLDGSWKLEGRPLAEVCTEKRRELESQGYGNFICFESTFYPSAEYIFGPNNITSYPLGIKKTELENAMLNLVSTERITWITEKFKSMVLPRLKEKYLISVAANIQGQSCQLVGDQTMEKAFSKIKPLFPARNFSLSSICDTAGSSSAGISKVAADFVNIVSAKYLIGLTSSEKVVSAKIKTASSSHLIPLTFGTDFKIENDQFVLLNQAYSNFENVELLIDRK